MSNHKGKTLRKRILQTAHSMTGTFTSPELAFAMRRHFRCWMVESSGTVGGILARDPHYERVGMRKVSTPDGGKLLPVYRVRK
jgi:hypothetical protein